MNQTDSENMHINCFFVAQNVQLVFDRLGGQIQMSHSSSVPPTVDEAFERCTVHARLVLDAIHVGLAPLAPEVSVAVVAGTDLLHLSHQLREGFLE